MIRRTFSIAVVLAALLLYVPAASPHMNDFTTANGTQHLDHWPQGGTAVWNINPAIGANITGSRSVVDVIQAAFNTWAVAPNASLSIARGTDSAKTSSGLDGTNLICFICTGDFTSEAETLAITLTTTATGPGVADGHGGESQFAGQILDADILFNTSKMFSTDSSGTGQDLQTVATHEIGHFFGLGHSAVVRAVMYPFSLGVRTTLSYDDVAGIAVSYGKPIPDVATGSIAGTVRLGASGVFGAHVFADSTTGADPFAGFNIRKSPIGSFSLPDGSYVIQGVPADSYDVTAEPLDSPVTDSDLPGYASGFGQSAVQTGFTTRWH